MLPTLTRTPISTETDSVRPKVKFLTAVWGIAYIERFAGLALPSFLAPGNLPALAAVTDLEVVIMTAKADIAHFDKHPTFRRLRAICTVRFVEIDDLITNGVYGVTLTLAYARPIISSGADMLNTHYVFMNADFVLADGSLRGLAQHILMGRSIVIAPSFRCTAEAVEPHLLAAVDSETGTLTMPPRTMVDLALRHPHATTLAKTVNLGFCHSGYPNQFFWQVDEHTVIGRFYLIFMLCLKPERIITTINSYCDYGFIPEMCPSGNTAVMADSDEFFMLELQLRDQEISLLHLGKAPNTAIARSLDEWTTAEHRRSAKHDLVFHSRDIPACIENASRNASAFISKIERMLGPPVPHAEHPYWVGGVETWRNRRREQALYTTASELGALSPEIGSDITELPDTSNTASAANTQSAPVPPAAPLKRRVVATVESALFAIQRVLMGRRPNVTLLHPDWLDYRLLRHALSSIQRSNASRVLVVRDSHDLPDMSFGLGGRTQFIAPADMLAGGQGISQKLGGEFSHVLIYLLRKDCRSTRPLLEKCRPFMAQGCACYVFIHHLHGEQESGNFSQELVVYFDDIMAWPLHTATFYFAGGLLKRYSRRLFNLYGRVYARSGARALLFLVPALVFTLPVVALINAYSLRKQRNGAFVQYCSSMLIRFVM